MACHPCDQSVAQDALRLDLWRCNSCRKYQVVNSHAPAVSFGQDEGGDAGHHIVRARWDESEGFAQDGSTTHGEVVIVLHDGGPSALHFVGKVADGERQCAVGRHVSCAGPVKLVAEAGGVAQWEGHAVADGQRMDAGLPVLAQVEKG